MVADQPATQTDQDGCPRRPSRPLHHFPTGRARCQRPDGVGYSRRHTPIASPAAAHETAILTQTE